jgi:hypothetical protein
MPRGAAVGAVMTLPDNVPAWVTAPAGMVTSRPPATRNEADFPELTGTVVAGAGWLHAAISPATVKAIMTPGANRLGNGIILTPPAYRSMLLLMLPRERNMVNGNNLLVMMNLTFTPLSNEGASR